MSILDPSTNADFLEKNGLVDLESFTITDQSLISIISPLSPFASPNTAPISYKFLHWLQPSSLKITPTSWLDGIRGVAAFEVYIFHALGCWQSLVPAWHADENQNNILQLPLIRTFFTSGGTAVSVFFALSGYVLTYKSLLWIRNGQSEMVYQAVGSSAFRRGFRLYLPPILLMFCEMLASRLRFGPPLNFAFVPEDTLMGQLWDWANEVNRLVNPAYNLSALWGVRMVPKYDPVIWTIPLEFYGSFVCYFLLVLFAKVETNRLRMGLVAGFSVASMAFGWWNLFCFAAGIGIADFNLGRAEKETTTRRCRMAWWTVFAAAFYVAGFPSLVIEETKLNPMPGFEILFSFIPVRLNIEDHARFLWSISGVTLLLCISQLQRLRRVFETKFCQYLGRIAFALYLIHEFCIVLFGLGIQRILLHFAGSEVHTNNFVYWLVCVVWFLLFTVLVFVLAALVEKLVDAPSVRFARWLEGKCLRKWRGLLQRGPMVSSQLFDETKFSFEA